VRYFGLMLMAAAQAALSHPGHGPERGWLHLLTEPDHLALMLAPPVIGVLVWLWLRRRRGGG
jgi:hydrogenase/urease accessory protein HupE